jgi:hypothetical protein
VRLRLPRQHVRDVTLTGHRPRARNPTVPSGDPAETSGPSLRLVLGGLLVLAVVLGVLAYWRYSVSERHFAEALANMDRIGVTADTEGCVSAVLEWHGSCEANRPLCDHGVGRVLTHCLHGADRGEYCNGLDLSSSKAQWVFARCEERGTPCASTKKCACADAYRAIDSYCRYGQKGVSL